MHVYNIALTCFVTVFCMSFVVLLCVSLKLLSLCYMPLLAPNPGDATELTQNKRNLDTSKRRHFNVGNLLAV